jgi:hypothetical protein
MKVSCACRALPILLLAILACSCNRFVNDPSRSMKSLKSAGPGPPLSIQTSESPASIDSREQLSATTDGRIILSWVEKVGAKHCALRFATRSADEWSDPRTVAEGENWFINWADFPSVIALADGSFAAHWLLKSGSGNSVPARRTKQTVRHLPDP